MKKEIIESDISILEMRLKWKGVPTFTFLSGLAALIWILLSDELYTLHLNYLIVLAFFMDKIIWSCLTYKENEIIDTGEIFNTFKVLKDDITNDLWIEVGLVFLCLYFISAWGEVNLPLVSYLVLNLMMLFSVFGVNNSQKQNDYVKLFFAKYSIQMSNRWVTRIHFTLAFLLNSVMAKLVYDVAIMKIDFNYAQKKSLVLITGIFLLVKLYLSGRSVLTIIEHRKRQLVNLEL